MKKILILAACLVTITACKKGNIETTIPDVAEAKTDTVNNAVIEAVKKEPKVKDATLTDANVLYVAVLNDGTDRSGYAQYICEVVRENKGTAKVIKVVEFGTMNSEDKNNAYGKLLGESQCE